MLNYGESILSIRRINELYSGSIKIIERLKEVYEIAKNNVKMNEVYEEHFEDLQRLNQQCTNLFSRPFLGL